jgi:hypothetical protein
LGITWWRSRWGRRAAGAYILLLSAAAGFATYDLAFAARRTEFPAGLMLTLGLPWTRTISGLIEASPGGGPWVVLIVSFAVNAAMLCYIGSRLEQLARGGER